MAMDGRGTVGCGTLNLYTPLCCMNHLPVFVHSEMVQVLVAHGASIGLRGGSDSWTPLMYAAMAGM